MSMKDDSHYSYEKLSVSLSCLVIYVDSCIYIIIIFIIIMLFGVLVINKLVLYLWVIRAHDSQKLKSFCVTSYCDIQIKKRGRGQLWWTAPPPPFLQKLNSCKICFCIYYDHTWQKSDKSLNLSWEKSCIAVLSCLFNFNGLADFWSQGRVITMVTPNRNYEL
jgi:hypothetical protein